MTIPQLPGSQGKSKSTPIRRACQGEAGPFGRPAPSTAESGHGVSLPVPESETRLKRWNADITDVVRRDVRHHFRDWSMGRDRLTRQDVERKLQRVADCGGLLEYRAPADDPTAIRLRNATFCHQPAICPFCAARLTKERMRDYRDPIRALADSYVATGPRRGERLHAYLVTATVTGGADLVERYGHLVRSWQRMRLMGQRRGAGRSRGEWGKVVGALAKVEIKRGQGSGLWHPHIHALVFTAGPLDFSARRAVAFRGRQVRASKITSEWLDATGDSMGFDVRLLERVPKSGKLRQKVLRDNLDYAESVYCQSMEVLKYSTKFSGDGPGSVPLSSPDYVTVMLASYSRRLFNSYGGFRGVVAGDGYASDDLPLAARPAIYSSRWRAMARAYSPLKEEKTAVFVTSDKAGESRRGLMTALNQVQGMYRRARTYMISLRPSVGLQNLEAALDGQTRRMRSALAAIREWARTDEMNPILEMLSARRDSLRAYLDRLDRAGTESALIESFRVILSSPPDLLQSSTA